MEFEWDEDKAAANLAKHRVPFAYVTAVFYDPARFEVLDQSQDYGEERYVTVGLIEEEEFTVVSTPREDRTRLISARRSTRHEREEYWKNRLLYL